MTLGQKVHVLYANAVSVLRHRAADPGARRHLYGYGVLALIAVAVPWLMLREIRGQLAWTADAGRPVIFKPVKAEQQGHILRVAYPVSVPCPTSSLVAVDKKGKAALEAMGVDTKRETVLATAEIPYAPFGVNFATTVDNATGEVREKGVVLNPLAHWENRWSGTADFVAGGDGFGMGAAIGADWEPASFRLGKFPFRMYPHVGAEGLLFSGRFVPVAKVGVRFRRP